MKRAVAGVIVALTISVSFPLFAQVATNAIAAEPAGGVSTNKPTITDLMMGNEFTNAAGMVLVKISENLWAGKYLVTQKEFEKVANSNPSQFQNELNPVDSVSWNQAMSFCSQLNEAEAKEEMLPKGWSYTLPTQAQWEMLMADATLDQAVTSEHGNRSGPAPVGSLPPNSLGLYDTRGNVWQWCLDPSDKPFRVLKGGAWNSFLEMNLRPNFRWYSNGPDDRKNTFGFRCLLTQSTQ